MAVAVVYNVDEVEIILKPRGISKTSLYRAISLGRLRAIKVGKRYIITEKALNYFLEGNEDTDEKLILERIK